ncbi:MAG: DUF5677 domain-containing protein [Chloroflexota bacterium]
MPTKPFEPLLHRELSKVLAKEIVDIASPLLRELVDYSTNAFERCQTSLTGRLDEHLPVLASYLHVIETTDGIQVLVENACGIPPIPLLRSSFEAVLAIEYILQDDCQRRSASWMVHYIHQRLNQLETLDSSSPKGRAIVEALATDQMGARFTLPMIDVSPAAKNLQSLLGDSFYQVAESEYQRVYRSRKRKPAWYSLFHGPMNLRELADRVGRAAQYDFLYRHWSTVSHAADLSRYLGRTKDGSPAFASLRRPKDVKEAPGLAASIILDATRKVLKEFRGGEEASFRRWYRKEVRARFLALNRVGGSHQDEAVPT